MLTSDVSQRRQLHIDINARVGRSQPCPCSSASHYQEACTGAEYRLYRGSRNGTQDEVWLSIHTLCMLKAGNWRPAVQVHSNITVAQKSHIFARFSGNGWMTPAKHWPARQKRQNMAGYVQRAKSPPQTFRQGLNCFILLYNHLQ